MAVERPYDECAQCGALLPPVDDADAPVCAECGGSARIKHLHIRDTVRVYGSLALKGKRPGEKRPFVKQKHGRDLHRDTGEVREVHRVIDRDNDRYTETIRSPTQGVVRSVDEPLREHRGHGAAKRHLPSSDDSN
jgi:hypothetical protein